MKYRNFGETACLNLQIKSKLKRNIIRKFWEVIIPIAVSSTEPKPKKNLVHLKTAFVIKMFQGIKRYSKMAVSIVHVAHAWRVISTSSGFHFSASLKYLKLCFTCSVVNLSEKNSPKYIVSKLCTPATEKRCKISSLVGWLG